MDPKLLGTYLFAAAFDVGMPLALAVFVRRQLGVSWHYFWYGALIFFLFQVVTRVPAVQILQGVLAGPLRQSEVLRWGWLFALALTAGLFEEVGRYLGYRHLVFRGIKATGDGGTGRHGDAGTRGCAESRTQNPGLSTQNSAVGTQNPALITHHSLLITDDSAWQKGVMYGLGHGGLESMLLVGGSVLLATINYVAIMKMDPASIAALPASQQEAVRQARAVLEGVVWWMPLLGSFERLCTVAIQVAFSILVLQALLRDSMRWLYLAIFAHFAVDFAAVSLVVPLGPVGTEGLIAVFALVALYLIFRLRPHPWVLPEPTGAPSNPPSA